MEWDKELIAANAGRRISGNVMGIMGNLLLSLFKSNEQLKGVFQKKIANKPISERRSNVGIAAIDDQPFEPQQNLSNYGYNIVPIGDLRSVSGIAKYDIILCDIMGVGQHFDGNLQGASIIKEIKRIYPEKYVIAYTGAAMNANVAKQAHAAADETLRKDIDVDEWVDRLDQYTNLVQNPYQVWLRIRSGLVARGIDTKDLLVLEDAFVKSVLNGDINFSAMRIASESSPMREDVRAIINGLISSTAFGFLFGG